MKTTAEMTDTELNRAMIWLYPPKLNITYSDQSGEPKYYVERKWQLKPINYLSDWDLTMPIAFDMGLSVDMSRKNTYASGESYRGWTVINKNPLRAICEVLVQIGMEGKK